MPKIKYIGKRFGAATLEVITHANKIIDEYLAQGYSLTLRQLSSTSVINFTAVETETN